MNLGYARANNVDTDAISQVSALKARGCDEIFIEHPKGGRWDTPQLKSALSQLEAHDIFIVVSLTALGRSLVDVLVTIQKLIEKKVELVSIDDQFDTRTPEGQKVVRIFMAFTELRRQKISETTKEGLEEARKLGRAVGRKPKLDDIEKARIAYLIALKVMTNVQIAKMYNVDPSVVSRIGKSEQFEKAHG